MTSQLEAFVEVLTADVGHNLRHWRSPLLDTHGHITGEGCACQPERVPHTTVMNASPK